MSEPQIKFKHLGKYMSFEVRRECTLVICRRMPDSPHHQDTHYGGSGDTMDCINPRPVKGECWQCK